MMHRQQTINFAGARSSLFGGAAPAAAAAPAHVPRGVPAGQGDAQMMAFHEQQEDRAEQEIYQHTESLSRGVQTLREISITISDTIGEQNRFLDGMGTDMNSTQNSLQQTMKKLNAMMQAGSTRHMCMLIGFVLLVIFVLYLIIKFR